jgi:UDP-N-acetylmuramate--alanine ligase
MKQKTKKSAHCRRLLKNKRKDFDILLTVGAGNIDTLYDPIMEWMQSL